MALAGTVATSNGSDGFTDPNDADSRVTYPLHVPEGIPVPRYREVTSVERVPVDAGTVHVQGTHGEYGTELFYTKDGVVRVHLAPLLPPVVWTRVEDILVPPPPVTELALPGLHQDAAVRTRLLWYSGPDCVPGDFIGTAPLGTAYIQHEQRAYLTEAVYSLPYATAAESPHTPSGEDSVITSTVGLQGQWKEDEDEDEAEKEEEEKERLNTMHSAHADYSLWALTEPSEYPAAAMHDGQVPHMGLRCVQRYWIASARVAARIEVPQHTVRDTYLPSGTARDMAVFVPTLPRSAVLPADVYTWRNTIPKYPGAVVSAPLGALRWPATLREGAPITSAPRGVVVGTGLLCSRAAQHTLADLGDPRNFSGSMTLLKQVRDRLIKSVNFQYNVRGRHEWESIIVGLVSRVAWRAMDIFSRPAAMDPTLPLEKSAFNKLIQILSILSRKAPAAMANVDFSPAAVSVRRTSPTHKEASRIFIQHVAPFLDPHRAAQALNTSDDEFLFTLPNDVVVDTYRRYFIQNSVIPRILDDTAPEEWPKVLHSLARWALKQKLHKSDRFPQSFVNPIAAVTDIIIPVAVPCRLAWRAIDRRTLQTFDPTVPAAWGSLVWQDGPLVERHPLFRALQKLQPQLDTVPPLLALHTLLERTAEHVQTGNYYDDVRIRAFEARVHDRLEALVAPFRAQRPSIPAPQALRSLLRQVNHLYPPPAPPTEAMATAYQQLRDLLGAFRELPHRGNMPLSRSELWKLQASLDVQAPLYPGREDVWIMFPSARWAQWAARELSTLMPARKATALRLRHSDTSVHIYGAEVPLHPALAHLGLTGDQPGRDLTLLRAALPQPGVHVDVEALVHTVRDTPGVWLGEPRLVLNSPYTPSSVEWVLARARLLRKLEVSRERAVALRIYARYPIPLGDVFIPAETTA